MKNLSKCQEMKTIQQENILDYLYHQNYYKLVGIDLPRQADASFPQ